MGAFRFSDVGRHLVVASTDMKDLSTTAISASEKLKMGLRPHYSQTEFSSDVYGDAGVYIDKEAKGGKIQLLLQ